ncbi:MAG: FHA domain-containing protein [Dehalococcoidia bacterium]
MRNALLLLTFALIFGVFSALSVQTAHVGALGAPTDNTTIPNVPAGDQSQDEIKPPVEYVLLEPTSQSKNTPPNFIAGFIAAPGQEEFTVTANENWYLDVDINTPGWIYIYEYFPVGGDFQGQWIAYKWQLLESGLWRLGPFTPTNNEPEGQHIYRIWFYSDGQWAAGEPDTPQNNLVYWTYSKGKPAEPVLPPSPIAPAKEASFPATVFGIITRPVLGASLLVVILALALLPVYLRRRRSQDRISPPGKAKTEELSAALPSAARAKIVLPNGIDIHLAGKGRVIGRGDLARALSLDDLGLISRRHFEVKLDDEQWYVEDLGSINSTHLNGKDISGQGPVSLDDGDIIEPAGAIHLKFHLF